MATAPLLWQLVYLLEQVCHMWGEVPQVSEGGATVSHQT